MIIRLLAATCALVALAFLPPGALAQEEVASGFYAYKALESSSGSYEEYEVRPSGRSPFRQWNETQRDTLRQRSGLRFGTDRSTLADSHVGIPFYETRTCASCHGDTVRNSHAVRAGVTCRQCHGAEPVAGINHYFSRMNPIRRHAYVCAKCHDGASASFATYLVHEPNPASAGALVTFPALAWAFWIMIGIAVATFALFLPHTALWWLRELAGTRRKEGEP